MISRKNGVEDYKSAQKIALIFTFIFLVSATLKLNTWPYESYIRNMPDFSPSAFFGLFKSLSVIFLLLFIGSKPSVKSCQLAFLSGALLTIYVAVHLKVGNPLTWLQKHGVDGFITLTALMSIPAITLLFIKIIKIFRTTSNTIFEQNLSRLFVVIILFFAFPATAFELGVLFDPLVYDLYAVRWDVSSGLNFVPSLYHIVNSNSWLPVLVNIAYGFTPIGFLLVSLKQLSGMPTHVASGAKTWLILSGSAIFAYYFFPVTGPKYIFGANEYIHSLKEWNHFPIQLVPGGAAPRNGMPSMHFGWMLASTLLWWRTGSSWWSKLLYVIATALTMTATLYLGEHYVVDLIVAVPFTLAAIALCTETVAWSYAERKWTVIGGFLTWFIWIVVLRELVPFSEQHPWFCWVMNGWTAIVVVFQSIAIKRFNYLAALPIENAVSDRGLKLTFFSTLERKVSVMFFASGAAALIYQVVFAKTLALTFGSTSTATLTVLSTFLGGMAIGSYLGGRFASQSQRPLFTYAAIEGLIALYCIATPALFHATQTLYVSVAKGISPDSPALLSLRVCLGGLVLIAPTILMGATLPLLAQILNIKTHRIGSKVALLYLANTAGATIGALICGYVLIPYVGITNTTLIAAVLNFLVALGGIELNKKWIIQPSIDTKTIVYIIPESPKYAMNLVLSTLGIGGLLSLGLEVTYVHMLSIVAGNSVYAFSLMLATFLSGLSIGGFLFKGLLERSQPEPLRWLSYALIGLALSTACSIYFWNAIPDYFASFAAHPPARTFAAREAIRAIVCALIMLPPTIFIGGAYVLGMDIITHLTPNKQIQAVGVGSAINTVGNIIGVVLFGFVLLPSIGGIQSIHVISLTALLLSMLVIVLSGLPLKKHDYLLVVFSGCLILVCVEIPLNYQALSSGANVYFAPQAIGKVIDHAESIDGGLTSVTQATGEKTKTLLTNGKFQGNNSWQGEMTAQIGFAIVPLMHQEKRDRALVIGYGTGVTSRVLNDAGFKNLDIAELSRDVVQMANKHFGEVNAHVTDLPHVHLHITDGRNMLLLASPEQRYDMISLEITSIWFAGAASLYNREFYQLAKAHLQPDGILQQWVQLHHLNPTDILSIISTARSEFKYVSLYQLGGQGMLIASNDPLRSDVNPTAINLVRQTSPLVNLLAQANQTIEHVIESRELDSQGIDRYLVNVGVDPMVWISDDNNLRLEYSTPKGNVNDGPVSYSNNMQLLRKYRSGAVR
ncbi:fused MFS/spermidine synthase [Undibacterium sp. MH2W]|uniref:fused MFS/spermidine synthase n=1 Tax=Undibacterium sp. MH2W TaxID=3413044 RepID=UPI003BF30769